MTKVPGMPWATSKLSQTMMTRILFPSAARQRSELGVHVAACGKLTAEEGLTHPVDHELGRTDVLEGNQRQA